MQLTTPTAPFDELASIDAAVSGFGGAHGGYVAAVALRAMRDLVPDEERRTRSLTVHLLAPVRPGVLDVHRRLDREGRSMAGASARLEQEGRTVATALASFGRGGPSLSHRGLEMPA